MINEMAEILNIDEIKSLYDGEWVLIGHPVTDESLSVVRGNVLSHSKDRDEVYRKARELKPAHSFLRTSCEGRCDRPMTLSPGERNSSKTGRMNAAD
jgi:hypothetical protein